MESKDTINYLAKKLPFDQFSRQKIVSYLIDESFRKKSKQKTFKIIDVGGHNGKTAEFQPDDTVFILDLFDENYENYTKGDATNTDFAGDSFDIVCSFDVLEHIPHDRRQLFVDEALRISKIGAFFTVPIDVDKRVSSAEEALNDFYKNLTGTDHKWLKEHIDFKIPNDKEISQLISNSGASQASVSSNQIGDWQLMQMLLFTSSAILDIVGEVSDINTWYNHNTLRLDSSIDIGYRKIIFISKDKKNVDSVNDSVIKLTSSSAPGDLVTVNKMTFHEFTNTLSLINKKYSALVDKYQNVDKNRAVLIDEIEKLKLRQNGDHAHIIKLTREITNIHDSTTWKIMTSFRSVLRFNRKSQIKKDKNV